MLSPFMLGAPMVLFPLILGALVPMLYLPLLGALTVLFPFMESASAVFRGKKRNFETLLEGG